MDRHVATLLAMTGMDFIRFTSQRLGVGSSSRNDMKRGQKSFQKVWKRRDPAAPAAGHVRLQMTDRQGRPPLRAEPASLLSAFVERGVGHR
jgi:hypothetical protein